MPSQIQAALLVILADETTVYPDDVKTLTARDLCPAIGLDTVHTGTIAANLVALRQRGLAWRQPGPGSGGWCITAEGAAAARTEDQRAAQDQEQREADHGA